MNNQQSIFDLLIIDIETVPQTDTFPSLSEDKQKLFLEKVSKTMAVDFDEDDAYQKKAGILAEFAKVICISTGFFYKDKVGRTCLKIKSNSGHDEKVLLQQFVALLDRMYKHNPNFQFAGHNIKEFDVPFLCRRMIINNMALPGYLNVHGAKPWEIKWLDTLHWWRFGDYKNYTSLHLLASALGVPTSKDDIDGSMVQHVYYQEKDLPRITRYCEKDVVVVARIIQKFMNLPQIDDEHIIKA